MAAGVDSQHSIYKCRSSSAGPQAAEPPQRYYCSSVPRFPSASTLSGRSYSKWHFIGMQPERRCCPTWSLSPLCCPTRPPGAYLFFQLNACFTSLQVAHGFTIAAVQGQAIPATPSQPIANGTVMAAPQQGQPHTPSQAPARARMPDPSAAIGLAVTQINAGKLDEADKLLTSIIDDTDKKAPNLGAHVARGTARALRRELQGADPCCVIPVLCTHISMPTFFLAVLESGCSRSQHTCMSNQINQHYISHFAGTLAFGGICCLSTHLVM